MAGTCGAMAGGKRRGGKRTQKKSKSKKMRGGMGYGFGGTIGTAGPVWNSSWGGEVTKAGTPVYDTADPQRGSSRRGKMRGGEDVEMVEATTATADEIARVGVSGLRAAGAVEVMPKTTAEQMGYTVLGPAEARTAPSVPRSSEVSGASRRRKSKKAKKGKSRRRTMRGGANWQSVAAVGHGYTGSGSRGLADPTAYASKVPPAGGPSQNADGAYHV
jgi:hypothetical protein